MKPPRKESRDLMIKVAMVITALATAGIFGVALWIGSTQKEVLKVQQDVLSLQEKELSGRRVANVEVIDVGGGFSVGPDPAGADWIYAEVTFRNISKGNVAKNIRILYQAYGAKSWSGYFDKWYDKKNEEIIELTIPVTGNLEKLIKVPLKGPPQHTIDIEPGDPFTTIILSQTGAKPRQRCSKDGERFLIALRIDWDNPNGAMGCRVTFIELSCPESKRKPPNNREQLLRLVPRPPESEIDRPPAIWPCPE
ncbi:MAG: hypothetical protein RX318_04550 [bacterium]|nr:hypothetical protein [bacterium]